MASLFDIVNRRKKARELADRFREGASPEELEYFDRFYQEPTSSPVWAQGALEGELDSADALQRALMARGMNSLQAQDAVRRAKEQEESALGTRAEHIAATRGPDQISGTGPGSYEDYRQSANTAPSPEGRYAAYKRQIPQVGTGGAAELLAEQGLPSPPQEQPASFEDWSAQQPPPSGPQPLSLEDWSRQVAMQQQMAGDVSAAADARYKSETVDDRIDMIAAQAETMPAELQAKGANAALTIEFTNELLRQTQIARENAPDTPEYQNAINAIENLHKIYKGTSGGGGINSYGAQDFIDNMLKEGITQSQAATQGDELNVVNPNTGESSKYGPGPRSYGTTRTEGDYGQGY
jgi:hypothetical protein